MPHIKEEQISTYIDKQMAADEKRALEIHMRECESCSAILQEMRAITNFFREAERLEPSPFLWDRIAVKKQQPAAPSWGASIMAGLRVYGRIPALATATLAILMIAGITAFHENKTRFANRAALFEIDKIYRIMAAQDPDAYNPFISNSPREWDANPFRSMRLGGNADNAQPAALPH
jgi:anti-sigma factor RsiW